MLEELEGRSLLSTITVNTTADTNPFVQSADGIITLRQAIMLADGNVQLYNSMNKKEQEQAGGQAPSTTGGNVIKFNIPDAMANPNGTWTIQVGGFNRLALPPITIPVTIDGTSKQGTPLIELDGELVINKANAQQTYTNGLTLGPKSSGSLVQGLVINRFTSGNDANKGNGILVLSSNNTIRDDDIGVGINAQGGITAVDADGKSLGNANDGVLIRGDDKNTASVNLIGTLSGQGMLPGDIIGGNKGNGVEISGQGEQYNKVMADGTGQMADDECQMAEGEGQMADDECQVSDERCEVGGCDEGQSGELTPAGSSGAVDTDPAGQPRQGDAVGKCLPGDVTAPQKAANEAKLESTQETNAQWVESEKADQPRRERSQFAAAGRVVQGAGNERVETTLPAGEGGREARGRVGPCLPEAASQDVVAAEQGLPIVGTQPGRTQDATSATRPKPSLRALATAAILWRTRGQP